MNASTTRLAAPGALCGLLFVSAPFPALAAERELDSHEHGASTLDLVIDGDSVYLTFEAPWNNLVGFEYVPESAEDIALVDEATARLEAADELFAFPASAGCRATDAAIESTMAAGDEHEEDHDAEHGDDHADEHDADGHGDEHEEDHDADADGRGDEHGDGHDAEHGDDHADEHDTDADGHGDEHGDGHDDHASSTHSEVVANYTFTCDDPDALERVGVALGATWSGIERVDVQLAGPAGQHAQRLEREDGATADWRVDLTPVMSR